MEQDLTLTPAPKPDIDSTVSSNGCFGGNTMRRGLNLKGTAGLGSIVEIVVTSVVFIIAAAGIMSTISVLKPEIKESSKKVEAAYIGKGILDEMRQEVNAADNGVFFGPNLDTNIGEYNDVDYANYSPDQTSGNYTVDYVVTEPIPNVRKVDMIISWPD